MAPWVIARDRTGHGSRPIGRCTSCGIGHASGPHEPGGAASTSLPARGAARAVADAIMRAELRPLTRTLAPGASVLDVGAGSGNRALQLHRLGYRVTALEPDPGEAARARRQLPAAVPVIEAGIEAMPADRTGYDAALLSHVLEHLEHPHDALRDLRARLRPGGPVVVMVPNAGGIEARLLHGRWHGWEPARHRWHHTRASLRRALLDAGYDDVDVRAAGGWRHPASLAYSLAPGLDPQIVVGLRAHAGRLLTALLAPVALAEVLAGHGPQLVATARAPRG